MIQNDNDIIHSNPIRKFLSVVMNYMLPISTILCGIGIIGLIVYWSATLPTNTGKQYVKPFVIIYKCTTCDSTKMHNFKYVDSVGHEVAFTDDINKYNIGDTL